MQRRDRERHQHQPGRIEQRPADQHAGGAEAVGHHAGQGLGHAPYEVLRCDRKGKGLARPAALHGHGQQEKALHVPDAQGQAHDRPAAHHRPHHCLAFACLTHRLLPCLSCLPLERDAARRG